MRTVGVVVLVGATLAGLWAVGAALVEGHGVLNTTQHVPWGLWVGFYLFFLGLSVGAYLLSTLSTVFGVERLRPMTSWALVQALVCLALGGFLVWIDLGHPARAFHIITSMNPRSVMAWMGFAYGAYFLILVASLHLVLRPGLRSGGLHRLLGFGRGDPDDAARARDRRWLVAFGIAGILVAIFVRGGNGGIFAVAKARPGWFGGLLPVVFLVSALASAGALLTFVLAAFSHLDAGRKTALARDLARLSLALLTVDLLLLTSEVTVTLYGNVPHEATSWRLMLFGPYGWIFWGVQLGLGFVVPALLVLLPRTRAHPKALGAAGLLMVLGLMAAYVNLVVAPQIPPAFDTLPDAYHHPRWEAGYRPSAIEWLGGLGMVTLGVWMFLFARRVLPMEERT